MTVLHDLKPNVEGCSTMVGGINCCSSAASSEISIDNVSATSQTTSSGVSASTKVECLTEQHNILTSQQQQQQTSQLQQQQQQQQKQQQTPSTSSSQSQSVQQLEQLRIELSEPNFPRCQEIDIEFENVRYTVRRFSFAERKFVTKEILHGINGAFRSGELTAIMGPSGSGKSTLLNVMTGFRATGVTGNISVNGKQTSTNSASFRELSCYIHQDDLLRPQLTVGETMMLAAHLKLGYKVSKDYKLNLIKHILSLLGLDHRYNVFTVKLSGGQKKRLAIALELISNPPVLYLDEPTTGLDSSSCSQCILLLKKLASQGHTIVCTIHQPSALMFEMFDKLYTVVEGNCIYQGPVRELIPFLADQDLICPSYHNPADFLLEVAVGEHERDLNRLINAANKKYYEDVDLNQLNRVTRLITKIQQNIESKRGSITLAANSLRRWQTDYRKTDDVSLEEMKALNGKTNANARTPKAMTIGNGVTAATVADIGAVAVDDEEISSSSKTHLQHASFFMQYILLVQRILICARRNYFLLLARILSHVAIGFLFGYLYMNVGGKANTVLGNYVYLYGTTLLLVYTGKMAVVLTFPLEIDMLTREHFNRWYGLGPYFLSLLSFEIPFQSICAVLYMIISVYLTGNYESESFRIYYFILLGIMATLSAQSWGFFVGATLPTKLAVFLGPILAVMFSVFGFCSRYIDITPLFRWMWHISYFRAGFHGALNAIYGMERPTLSCPDTMMYCHFRSPKVFLNYMMIQDVHMADCIQLMGTVIVVMHLLTIITLWHKLNKR